MHRAIRPSTRLLLCLLVAIAACRDGAGPLPPRALELAAQGLAQLENEQPDQAEATYRELLTLVPGDPLPAANLAIALLRQQKNDEALAAIDQALAKAPGRGDLAAIRGDVLQWSGRAEEALAAYQAASQDRPEDLEILFALLRHANTMSGPAAQEAAAGAIAALVKLRPENVVVLLARGHQAIAAGDRTAATGAFLRVRELLWQAPEVAARAMAEVTAALEGPDLAAARTPALRLENVLKITAMYREGQRELATGVQGLPVRRFVAEPPPAAFGEPIAVRFVAEPLVAGHTLALASGDFDRDGRVDVARLLAGPPARIEVSLAKALELPADEGLVGLSTFDLDNDGRLDLLAHGPGGLALWIGDGAGGFARLTEKLLPPGLGATAVAAIDFDVEGDLDLALAGGEARDLELLLNDLQGPLRPAGAASLPGTLATAGARSILASDLDRDGDLDLALAHEGGITWLDNQRQGTFADRSAAGGLSGAPGPAALASADLDGDGRPELLAAGRGLTVFRNRGGRFEAEALVAAGAGPFSGVLAFDADNDGRLDVALAGDGGVTVLRQLAAGAFEALAIEGAPASSLVAADLDRDGDLDLAAGGEAGLVRLINDGGNRNGWLAVRLEGLDQGNSKNNLLGLGSTIELSAGLAYQFREVQGDVTHFGLGSLPAAQVMRVVWTNGVPQNRLAVARDQQVVEEQILKGSCPFLYTWDGREVRFVSDLLWGAPLGMPIAPGVWAGADPEELVKVEGAVAIDGVYDLRVTEELWEAAFFDVAKLWVVDHPAEVEVASSLKILLGQKVEDRVLASRDLLPMAAVWDGRGVEVSERVRSRDEVYADGFEPSRYQGVAVRPWTFTFDLGEAPAAPVRLHLDGWIFPADASLNLALAQRSDLTWGPPRLEVETAAGWQTLLDPMPFPAGKTKTMVIDTPALPAGSRRLRIVTTQWLHWDRLAWTKAPADHEPMVRAKLAPTTALLRYRGFSNPERSAPNGPHRYAYAAASKVSPWQPLPGSYTRYGDVRPLLEHPDDQLVILAPGDELHLRFDTSTLPPPAPGHVRTVFLESHGWDKDADKNTFAADRLEPLPFRAMTGYPYGPGESYPETPELELYRRTWLTREVGAGVAGRGP